MTSIPFGDWILHDHRRAQLCWHRRTGELVLHHPSGDPKKNVILAVVADETEVRARLHGWEHHSFTGGGLKWLAEQLDGYR